MCRQNRWCPVFTHTPFSLPIPDILCQTFLMKNLTSILSVSLVALFGVISCAPNTASPPKITTSNATPYQSELSVKFNADKVDLRSGPSLRNSITRRLDKGRNIQATLIKQEKNWIKIGLDGEHHWVHQLMVNKNLTPPIGQFIFNSSTINLRSEPSEQTPAARVLKNARYRIGVPLKKSGEWIRVIFEKRPYWVRSSEVDLNSYHPWSRSYRGNHVNDGLSFMDEMKRKALTGDSGAMEMVGLFYEQQDTVHLEMSYMWLSLAMEKASPEKRVEIQKHLDERVIPKLSDFGIKSAIKRMERCREKNDCDDTQRRVFIQQ